MKEIFREFCESKFSWKISFTSKLFYLRHHYVLLACKEQNLEMIKRNEAAKRAGEMGIEYDMSNITASKPVKYHSTAGNDKAVPQGTNIETTVKDAEGDVSLSGIEQRHMLMQRLSRAPQESFL